MLYTVIMAGGQGTRLWPLSRKNAPKQLQALASNKSLIQETYERLLPIVGSPEQIIVSTNPTYVREIKKQLPKVPKKNFIIEPFPMNTAAACILTSAILAKREPNPMVLIAYSDHAINNDKRFKEIILGAETILGQNPESILTIGIEPTRPDTGLGYIQFGKEVTDSDNLRAFKVKRFVEKPDLKTAEKYLASFEYLWNTGLFMWHANHLLNLAQKLMPQTYEAIAKITEAWGTASQEKTLKDEYAKVEKTSIDYGIMEKTKDILVVPADFGWSDIGSWGTLYELLSNIQEKDTISRGHHVGHEDENTLVFAGDKLIATVGLKDIVVVDTPDALLICNRHRSQEVKNLLGKLEGMKKEKYL
jgi:mannose-1-phosphate guanylyltransferase